MSSFGSGKTLINDQINHTMVRVIDSDGVNLGILSKKDALDKAGNGDLDLVMVHCPINDDYPICKIIDYSKFKYEQKTKRRKKVSKSKSHKRKEIFLSMNIGDHDKKTKLKKIVTFLSKNMEVVVGIKLKGRYRGKFESAKSKLVDALQSEDIPIDDNNWRISRDSVSLVLHPK